MFSKHLQIHLKKFEILVEELAIRLNNDDNNESNWSSAAFTTIDGKETSIGKFFAQEVTLALANKRKSFKIVDRLVDQRIGPRRWGRGIEKRTELIDIPLEKPAAA